MKTEPEWTAIRTCPICEATCGLRLTMRGDRVARTAGDGDDVFSDGYMCPKGATLGEMLHDPDWLRKPLVRREGELVEATWEEALSEAGRLIREVMRDHGPAAIAHYLGNPIGHSLGGLLYPRTYIKAIGSPNVYGASSLDQRPKDVVNGLMYGDRYTLAVPDIDRTQLLVVFGANPMESNGSLATAPGWPRRLVALKERGGQLVVVDPIRTRTADLADLHIQPRVGSDAALLLSIVHVLFDEDLIGRPNAALEYATGLAALRDAIASLAPEGVEHYTGVPADEVRALARRIAGTPQAVVYGRIGTTTTLFGSLASWAVELINLLTGHLDVPGGAMFPLPAAGSANTRGRKRFGRPLEFGRARTRVRQAPDLFGEFPTACLAEEIDTPGDGRYRALVLLGGNPVVSSPNAQRMEDALKQLDVLIAIDPYLNDSTRHAHVILPPLSPLQRSHYDLHFYSWAVRNVANYSKPVLPPEAGQWDEWQIMCALAAEIRGGTATAASVDDDLIRSMVLKEVRDENSRIYGADAEEVLAEVSAFRGPERLLDFLLRVGPYGDAFGRRPGGLSLGELIARPHGVDLGALRPRLPEVLRTPNGLIDLAPELLVGDVPRLLRVVAEVKPTGLVLTTNRRQLRSNNSWLHNAASLMTGQPRCTVLINPREAADRGLRNGDYARVTTRVGSVEALVEVTDRAPVGVLSIPHGWIGSASQASLGVARGRPGVNANVLTDDQVVDVPSWTAVFGGIPVTIEPLRRARGSERT